MNRQLSGDVRSTECCLVMIWQCCCQGLTSRGQGQGQGLEVRGQGRGQGLKFQILKHLLNNDINFLE